jgi:putative pyruvate formate lyase activating enzyme
VVATNTAPSYIKLYSSGRLGEIAKLLRQKLASCDLCPRLCRVNRLVGELGYCRGGELARVASYGPHFGEERPLVGTNGSGTIFFCGCNLGCIFCQNSDISQGLGGEELDAKGLAGAMLYLQSIGCHNINLVTPTHFLPQILSALAVATEGGLRLPMVYNCGGYERQEIIREIDGVMDIYMPDFKFWESAPASRYCSAEDYPERAKEAIKEMHRQVGDLQTDEKGIATRGLILRHLLLPENLAGTAGVAHFVASEISPNTYFNLMDQYRPSFKAFSYPELSRRITAQEYERARQDAQAGGLRRLD